MFQTRTRLRKRAQFVTKTYRRLVHLPNAIWDVYQPNDLDRIRIDPVDGTGACSAVDSFHAVHPQIRLLRRAVVGGCQQGPTE